MFPIRSQEFDDTVDFLSVRKIPLKAHDALSATGDEAANDVETASHRLCESVRDVVRKDRDLHEKV